VINFEAGLLVYWITTNTWTIGQQLFVRRFLPPPEPHIVSADGGAAGGKGKPGSAGTRAPLPKGGGSNGGGEAARPKKKERGSRTAAAVAKGSGGGNGSEDGGPKKAPPPSPRKKKKRSGRRR
jgi:YidC/Oxa1 family membrane protein insertase